MGDIKVRRYETLRECFLKCIDHEDISEEETRTHFWVGHDGRKGYRIRVDRWLARQDVKVWGWADYKSRTLHVFVSPEADIFEVIELLSHEIGHFQRPRYPFGHDEEKKAATFAKVTTTAINIAKGITGKG